MPAQYGTLSPALRAIKKKLWMPIADDAVLGVLQEAVVEWWWVGETPANADAARQPWRLRLPALLRDAAGAAVVYFVCLNNWGATCE